MTLKVTILTAVAALGAATATPAGAAVTFGQAQIAIDPYTYVVSGSEVDGRRGDADATVTSLPTLPITRTGTSTANVTGASATATQSASLTFTSPSAGRFGGTAAYTAVVTSGDFADAESYGGNAPFFSYYFNTSSPAIFSWTFASSGSPNGYARFVLNSSEITPSNGSSGVISLSQAGFYSLIYFSYVPGVRLSGTGNGASSYASNFSFTLTSEAGAVPEPGAWILMIAGFGLAGGMMRRMRVRPQPASI